MSSFKDVAHLLRLVVLIAVGILLFLGFRNWAVPLGFGQYGHYRGPALNDIRAQQISFAGQDVCEACHTEEHDKVATGTASRSSLRSLPWGTSQTRRRSKHETGSAENSRFVRRVP